MKTIILSLTIVLAIFVSPAFAQSVTISDGNNAIIDNDNPNVGYVPINIETAMAVKDIPSPLPAYGHFPAPKIKRISPSGFLYKEVNPASVNTGTAPKVNIKNKPK